MNTENIQKKIAVLGDLTGYGRCALTVSLPILSAHGFQACPVPTAILSNHTGFSSFFMEDYTAKLPDFFSEWKKLNLRFDGILTGFLGSKEQVDLVISFLQEFKTPATKIIVDPVMGDNGTAYQTFTPEHCLEMRKLAALADILTPNITEACLLTDIPYKEHFSQKELCAISRRLLQRNGQKLVITGLLQKERIGSFFAERLPDGSLSFGLRTNKKITGLRCGTGDVFSSLIAADALLERNFADSVKSAGRFVCKCLVSSEKRGIEKENGVCFEEFMHIRR